MQGAGQPHPGHGVQFREVKSLTHLPGKVAPHSWHMTSFTGLRQTHSPSSASGLGRSSSSCEITSGRDPSVTLLLTFITAKF